MPGRGKRDLAGLEQLLAQLVRHLSHVERERGFGNFSLPQLYMLKRIEKGSKRVRDLSFGSDVSTAAVSKLVDHLVRKGLVSRRRSRRDRRETILAITREGRGALRESARARLRSLRVLLEPLTDEEFAILTKMLRKLVASVSAAHQL